MRSLYPTFHLLPHITEANVGQKFKAFARSLSLVVLDNNESSDTVFTAPIVFTHTYAIVYNVGPLRHIYKVAV